MAVNIEVDLDLATREIAEVEAKLASIGDGVDFEQIDLDEIISGDLDDVLESDDLDVDIGSSATFRDFQNWVSEGGDDSGTGLPFGGIDTDVLGDIDPGGGNDSFLGNFYDTLPVDEADQIPARALVDTHGNRLGTDEIYKGVNVPDRLKVSSGRSGSGIKRHDFIDGQVDFENVLPDTTTTRRLRKTRSALLQINGIFDSLSGTVNRLRPRIGQIYNAIAALIPVLIGLVGAGAAAAISLSSLLAIGGAIGILGALGGEADTLKGSVKDLEDQMNNFKKELFQALQPAADPFAPLFDRGLDLVVAQVRSLQDELLGFQQFGGLFLGGIEGAGSLTESLFQQFNRLSPMIQQMARRVGGFIQTALPGFFADATREAFEHQNAVANILGLFWRIGRLVYNASVILLEFISAFSFLGIIISFVADLLNNRFFRALVIVLGTMGTVAVVLLSIAKLTLLINSLLLTQGGILSALASTWIGGFITRALTGLSTLLAKLAAVNTALTYAAAALSVLTGGVIAIAGLGAATAALSGNSPSQMPGGSAGQGTATSMTQNTEINLYGDTNEKDRQFVKDMASEDRTTNDLTSGEFTTF